MMFSTASSKPVQRLCPRARLALVGLCMCLSHVSAGHLIRSEVCDDTADIVVVGGTVCGATAVVAASRTLANANANADPMSISNPNRIPSVLWLVNGSRLGGMTSGGLGGLDHGMPIGGVAAELFGPLSDNFEPHVAEAAVVALVENATAEFAKVGGNLTVVRNTGWLASVQTTTAAQR